MASPITSPRHWVIGDVHGCHEPLRQLLRVLPGDDRLVFCGDVINRGPAIGATMELVWQLVESGRALWLRGNHEESLLADLRRGDWQALRSLAGSDTYRQLGDRRCRAWQERLESLPLAYWGEEWVATHAGFDPISWRPHLSIRLSFWMAYDQRYGEVIVGHTPGPDVRHIGAGESIALIDTGACYGGRLTAYCPESRETISVPGLARPMEPFPLGRLRSTAG